MVSFKERIAREVMVPRIDVFSLSSDTTIKEAAENFLSEGYSRIPVYKDSVDHIIGVLHYKDILRIYAGTVEGKQGVKELYVPIEAFVKPVLYTPETKKISHLLQEFRSKQIHLAIVVDEYGGTEGIVTIEDILEELVGEIADEYDIEEEVMFSVLPTGGWVVDARMNIIDIEEDLGIKIPQGPEYDTIGGYIFHRAGSIPSKGWRLHHDDFDLEILSSNDRSIDKIRITPHVAVQ
jgi:CBS domain containing-hemolysin-like protein